MARGETKERGATRADSSRGDGAPSSRDVIGRQREEFGGLNWGAAFFGWLVAIGVASLLTAILSAAGAAIPRSGDVREARPRADSLETKGGVPPLWWTSAD